MNEHEIERGDSFKTAKTRTQTLQHAETSRVKYDLIGKIAEGRVLTRKTVAKLPKGFHIPTPVGNYSPDWAIAFNEGAVKHIYFIAETKGTMESLNLRPIEQAKISCAKKLFNEISTSNVKYHDVDSYQSLLTIMNKI